MSKHSVCPWWIGYLLVSPIRRLLHNPTTILRQYVRPGMTVLEPGPGMGFFTLELARRVGDTGRVVAIDVQPKMLKSLKARAAKAGLGHRIDDRLASPGSMNIPDLSGRTDFALLFAVAHEMPSIPILFKQLASALKPGATALLAEPAGHVKASAFEAELADAVNAGFAVVDRPHIRRSHAAVLRKICPCVLLH